MSEKKKGRPVVYKGNLKRAIISVVKVNGLSGAMEIIQNDGVTYQPAPGKPKVTEKHKITLPTLAKFAKEAGIVLKRGRPSTGKATPAKKKAAVAETLAEVVSETSVELAQQVQTVENIETETQPEAPVVAATEDVELDLNALSDEVQEDAQVEAEQVPA